ncbi:hypothetical protein JKP88DRAFT_246420 [Tribonema minus]|uniref:CAAX prenyl protease 2/Lysostaphin resistance protein A-like domain-containing protein n=1 Tax=Tribonema minus TaxID=303371 RepID=A0A835YST5_9STRA|nr:hypothetical protein JKP88DRAFT_246420 [Tribonema minus]
MDREVARRSANDQVSKIRSPVYAAVCCIVIALAVHFGIRPCATIDVSLTPQAIGAGILYGALLLLARPLALRLLQSPSEALRHAAYRQETSARHPLPATASTLLNEGASAAMLRVVDELCLRGVLQGAVLAALGSGTMAEIVAVLVSASWALLTQDAFIVEALLTHVYLSVLWSRTGNLVVPVTARILCDLMFYLAAVRQVTPSRATADDALLSSPCLGPAGVKIKMNKGPPL